MASILVVDDEAYRTRAYREALRQAGHEVTFCSMFDEADELLWNPDFQISLLIQDLQMGRPIPGDRLQINNAEWEDFHMLSGLWFLHRCRNLLLSRKVPVLILTQKTAGDWQVVLRNALNENGVWCDVRHKVQTAATELPAIVKSFLDRVAQRGWPCPQA